MARKALLIGVGSGWGARDMRTANGPSSLFQVTLASPKTFYSFWHDSILEASTTIPIPEKIVHQRGNVILAVCQHICEQVVTSLKEGSFPIVIGGDHSIAMGTWAGVKKSLSHQDFGLIWIDAHMDAHTPKTTESGAIHGMPVASLLGYGDQRLIRVGGVSPKIHPQNLVLMGVRSFEPAEQAFLQRLGVKIYYMEEIHKRGFQSLFEEARATLLERVSAYGISLDIDAIDPIDAPGTGSPEPGGISADALISVFERIRQDSQLLALEIAEFNPQRDQDNRTLRFLTTLIMNFMEDRDDG